MLSARWDQLTDPRSREAVEIGERFADGLTKPKNLTLALSDGWAATREICEEKGYDFDYEARRVPSVFNRARPAAFRYAVGASGAAVEYAQGAAWMAECVSNVKELAANCHLFRDIFGNPFRPVEFDPAWRTDTAVSLAKQMYESREFSRDADTGGRASRRRLRQLTRSSTTAATRNSSTSAAVGSSISSLKKDITPKPLEPSRFSSMPSPAHRES